MIYVLTKLKEIVDDDFNDLNINHFKYKSKYFSDN